MMTSVTSRATFQNSDVIFIWLDISNFENNNKDIKKYVIILIAIKLQNVTPH
jgi:hypothetical protein